MRWRVKLPSLGRVSLGCAAAVFAVLGYSWIMLPDVRPLATRPPSTTAFMRLRAEEARRDGRRPEQRWRWASYDRIAPSLRRAVLLSEDARFWVHDGLDLVEMQAAVEATWERGVTLRGASTITQQLAKNLYLSPSRNPYRKAVELLIARRLEAELTKRRILELYLNVVEWGDGVWGAEAAARTYFGRSAADVSVEQSALLAASLINPRVYSPARPNARLLDRRDRLLERLQAVMGTTAPF